MSGDLEAAIRAYERALLVDSTSIAVHNQLAYLYMFQGRLEDSERLYRRALSIRPVAALAQNLAAILYRKGDLPGAAAAVDSAMARLPDWVKGYELNARFAGASGRYDVADSLLALLDSHDGTTALDRADGRQTRFQLAAIRGRLREAERVLTAPGGELFTADPAFVGVHRAALHLQRGDTVRAVELARSAGAQHAASGESHLFLSVVHVLADAGAAEQAGAFLDAWAAAVPEDALGIGGRADREYAAGLVALAREEHDRALSAFEGLRGRCPSCGAYLTYQLARTLDAVGQLDRAVEEYERFLSTHDPQRLYDFREVPRTLWRLGELYEARGEAEKAAGYYAGFVQLWSDADPELQPQVVAASERLRRLLPDRR